MSIKLTTFDLHGLVATMGRAFRILGWIVVFSIAVLSLVPAEFRPHTSLGHFEHFSAYFVATSLLILGYWGRQRLIIIPLAVTGYAAALEIAQLWVPGRLSRISDFVGGSLGAWVAIVLIGVAFRLFPQDAQK